MPPLWTLAAMAILGLNEFLVVLYNPLWLLLLIIVFLFGKTVYQELDIDGELQAGLLPGLLSISAKLWPTLTQVGPPPKPCMVCKCLNSIQFVMTMTQFFITFRRPVCGFGI